MLMSHTVAISYNPDTSVLSYGFCCEYVCFEQSGK
jgi:hypothetical protein